MHLSFSYPNLIIYPLNQCINHTIQMSSKSLIECSKLFAINYIHNLPKQTNHKKNSETTTLTRINNHANQYLSKYEINLHYPQLEARCTSSTTPSVSLPYHLQPITIFH